MAVSEDLTAYSTTASSNTPAGGSNVGPDLDNHLRDMKKNIRRVAERFQGVATPPAFRGRMWLDTSATASSRLTLKMYDGSNDVTIQEIDTSAGVPSYYAEVKRSTDLSGISSGVITKVTFNEVVNNLGGGWASDRFTPKLPGTYLIVASLLAATADQLFSQLLIYRSGAAYQKRRIFHSGTNLEANIIVGTQVLDGKSEYLEIYWRHNNSPSATINGDGLESRVMIFGPLI